jgi:hypothetical protein
MKDSIKNEFRLRNIIVNNKQDNWAENFTERTKKLILISKIKN